MSRFGGRRREGKNSLAFSLVSKRERDSPKGCVRDVEKMKEMKDRRRVSRIEKITFTNYRVYQTISLV